MSVVADVGANGRTNADDNLIILTPFFLKKFCIVCQRTVYLITEVLITIGFCPLCTSTTANMINAKWKVGLTFLPLYTGLPDRKCFLTAAATSATSIPKTLFLLRYSSLFSWLFSLPLKFVFPFFFFSLSFVLYILFSAVCP